MVDHRVNKGKNKNLLRKSKRMLTRACHGNNHNSVLADLFFVLCRGCFVVYANRILFSYFPLFSPLPSLFVAGWRRKRRGCGRAEIHGGWHLREDQRGIQFHPATEPLVSLSLFFYSPLLVSSPSLFVFLSPPPLHFSRLFIPSRLRRCLPPFLAFPLFRGRFEEPPSILASRCCTPISLSLSLSTIGSLKNGRIISFLASLQRKTIQF